MTGIPDMFAIPDDGPPYGTTETCPECATPGIAPHAWEHVDPHTPLCAYTCTNCHGTWQTSWWDNHQGRN